MRVAKIMDTEEKYRQDDQKRKILFGERVKTLRLARGWTSKEKFAKEHNFSKETIKDIESGKLAKLTIDIVGKLADIFELRGVLRQDFFNLAGIHYPETKIEIGVDVMLDFYRHMPFPAFIDNVFFDLHSFNYAVSALFQIDMMSLGEATFESGGPNVLRLLFDPKFQFRSVYGDTEAWEDYVKSNIYLFCRQTSAYTADDRYRELLSYLKRLPDFRRIWDDVMSHSYMPKQHIATTLFPNSDHQLTFVVSQATMTLFLAKNLFMGAYIPSDERTTAFFASLTQEAPNTAMVVDWKNQKIVRHTWE